MRKDIPVEEPSRRVSAAGPHAWQLLWGWELLLVATIMVPVVFLALSVRPPGERALAAAGLLAILPLYFFLGRPAILEDRPRSGLVYIVLMIACYVPSAALFDVSTFTLFGVCTQAFLVLPARQALVGVLALSAGPVIRILRTSSGRDAVFDLLVLMTIVIFFSGTFGVWIERITKQSSERAKLIEELENTRAEVAKLSAERGAQEERERLAGEIHDTLAQGFTSIIMLVQAAQAAQDPARHLGLAVQTAKENLAEARALISALAPPPLDASSLAEAMRRVAGGLDLPVEVEVEGESRPLPTHTDVVLVRALQEGLANVRKHASASSVLVRLVYGEQAVRLSVTDDGVGFTGDDGFGLRTMRGRVEQAGGSLAIRSAPGDGTTLTVEVPA
ncbi:sensor histidine kinase [Nonomuraea sp. NPDC050556]|uniref:sensor histidine kinase n=1 Tax=Nonomuraea sp. NPDC050556 TaxID=3364369 RepID=UPI00378CD472